MATKDIKKKNKANTKESKTNKINNEAPKINSILKDERAKYALGLLLFFITFYLILAHVSFFFTGNIDQSILTATPEERQAMKLSIQNWTGIAGATIAEKTINNGFGIPFITIFIFPMLLSFKMIGIKVTKLWKSLILPILFIAWAAPALHLCFAPLTQTTFISVGGLYGENVNNLLRSNIGFPGTLLTIVCTGIVFAIFAFQSTIPTIKKLINKKIQAPKTVTEDSEVLSTPMQDGDDNTMSVKIGDDIVPAEWTEQITTQDPEQAVTEEIQIISQQSVEDIIIPVEEGSEGEIIIETTTSTEEETITLTPEITTDTVIPEDGEQLDENVEPYDPKLDLSQYKYPTLELLKDYPTTNQVMTEEEQRANQTKIITTLKNFGIGVKKIFETIGPTITLYEIVPEDGVRITKIKNLEADIMLSLSAVGIRIIAPMPGKGTIGIEVPNSNPKIVSMFATIASKKFQEASYDLPVVLGRTITNDIFMFDLCKMPHLLVAGATGQGKSVGLNAIITSLLYKKHPSELKFVLVDPKKVEFNIYGDIEKHFLAALPDADEPVITDTSLVVQTLNSICKEMDNRYELLKAAKTRNIKEYNDKFINRRLNPLKGHRFLPYIVVIVDEFGDLIMTAGKEVELPIARIAQLARAVGIHMIIATQRPSVNIITGIIKANFPARIAFKVSSGVDSKTILDGPGADRLIGRGDMLFSQGSDTTRVQCAFVDTPEVENIVNYISSQQGYSTHFQLPEPDTNGDANDLSAVDMSKRDPYFEEVARYIVSSQTGSTSNIQRKFEIGFNRAGRIMDQIEVAGIVGPTKGSKPREVLIQTEVDLEYILKSFK